MTSKWTIILVAVMLVLAGCSGGDDDDDDDDPITIESVNDEAWEHVSPGDGPNVTAEVSGNPDDVYLEYEVTNRSGTTGELKKIDMTDDDGDGEWEAVEALPAEKPGHVVDFWIKAEGDETDQQHHGYTVSYVESMTDPGSTSTLASEIDVTLETHEDVNEVYVEYEKRDSDGSVLESGTSNPVENPSQSEMTFEVDNTVSDSDAPDEYGITYNVVVEYGPEGDDEMVYESLEGLYNYSEQDENRILYVPIMIPSDDIDGTPYEEDLDTLQTRASKAEEYFAKESDGEVDFVSSWFTKHPDDPYVELDGPTHRYLDNVSESGSITGKIGYGDRRKAMCDVVENHLSDQHLEEHTTIVFVFPNLPNQSDTSDYHYFRGSANAEAEPPYCDMNSAVDHDLGFAWVGTRDSYDTYVHELGHSEFRFADYYDIGKRNGEIERWGIMGTGKYREDHPSQVIAYNKEQAGWVQLEDRSSSEISGDEYIQRKVRYLRLGGGGLNLSIAEDRENSIFNAYLFEARDPENVDHLPERIDGGGAPLKGQGIVVYGLTHTGEEGIHDAPHDVNVIRNQMEGENHVTLEALAPEPLLDPDTGLEFFVVDTDNEGATVRIQETDHLNDFGVNIYMEVECGNIEDDTSTGDCDELLDEPPENPDQGPLVRLQAQTDNGTVGLTENGTVVNEADGEVLIAGQVQKVFVDGNSSVEFVVETDDRFEDANVTFNVTTQTVVWDENGERTASEATSETVEPGEEATPELARLELNRTRFDAGQQRTLEGNSTTVVLENTGVKDLENVTVSTDSEWITLNRTDIESIGPAKTAHLGVDVNVPGGAPVGNYTFNVTISGEGTEGYQNETVRVTVEVLPTVRWSASPTEAERDLAYTNETTIDVTVTNDDSSNVPLRDVETTVSGNVTRFEVDAPAAVETVAPGETVTLTTTVSVPSDGIDEGVYDGLIEVDTIQHHQRFVDYPIDVPDDYVVPDKEDHRTDVAVEAHGPSVNSTASFHPDRQVAMRQGSTTMTATVQPVTEEFEPPAEGVTVRAEIPDGWELQGSNLNAHLTVWVAESNDAGKAGARVRLDPDDYEVTTTRDAIVISIDDVRDTEYGAYLTTDDHLEFEVTLNKAKWADDYEYEAAVDAQTHSPWAIYRHERPAAAIDVFDPRPGTAEEPVSDRIDRVPDRAVRVDGDGEGVNATLTNPRQFHFDMDGEDTWWLVMDVVESDRGDRQVVWLPLSGHDGSFQGEVTDDGYLVVDGYATANTRSAVASEMRSATPVRIQLPADTNLTADETVTVDHFETTEDDGAAKLIFETPGGETASAVNATAEEVDGELDVRIPAVVGEDVVEEDDEDSQAALARPASGFKAPAAG